MVNANRKHILIGEAVVAGKCLPDVPRFKINLVDPDAGPDPEASGGRLRSQCAHVNVVADLKPLNDFGHGQWQIYGLGNLNRGLI
jgi:hypothetical protein